MLILRYSHGMEQSRISYFQALNVLVGDKIVGAFATLSLGPTRWITPPSPKKCPMGGSYAGDAHQVLAKQRPAYIILPNFFKTSSPQNF